MFLILFSSLKINAQNPQWVIYQTGNSGLPSNDITDIVIDCNNVKWIATDNGLVKFFGQQWTIYDTSNSGLTENLVWKLAVDNQNNLWIGTIHKGLMKYDGTSWTKYDTINSLGIIIFNVMGIQVDSLNNLWVCNNNGLLKLSSNNNWTLYNTTNSGLPDNMTTDIKIEENIKWIGTVWHGLVKYNDTNWVIYNTTNSGLPMNFVRSIFIDNNKNKWVGTYMGGAAKFNSQNNNWLLYNTIWPGFPGNDIRTIFIENNQVKWFGIGGEGAIKYNDTVITIYGYPLLNQDFVYKITSDKYNNIWIATANNGLAVYNPTGVVGINYISTEIQNEYKLFQNYPNPFNPKTKIKFEISSTKFRNQKSEVKIRIIDILGKEVAIIVNEKLEPGIYEVTFDGSKLSSGIYFYQLISNEYIETKKMLFIK